jgi:hypothetical protein
LDRDKKEAPEGTSLCFIKGSPVYDGFGQMGVQTTFSCNGFLLPPILTGKEVWITVENAFDCCKADISAIFIS